MDLRDARRLGSTCLVVAGALLLWLILLALDDAALFEWAWPTDALEQLTLSTWLWIVAGVLVVLVAGLVGIVFAMGLGGKAPTRQVQCGDCRAVFFIPDNGRRPLSHPCPSCKALGVYEEPEEKASRPAPAPAAPVRRMSFNCPSCKTVFTAADNGLRPLRVTCPNCSTSGTIR